MLPWFFQTMLLTLPETNSKFAPTNGWLEYEDVSYWVSAYFQGLAVLEVHSLLSLLLADQFELLAIFFPTELRYSLKLTANAPENGGPLEFRRFLLETTILRGELLVSGRVNNTKTKIAVSKW